MTDQLTLFQESAPPFRVRLCGFCQSLRDTRAQMAFVHQQTLGGFALQPWFARSAKIPGLVGPPPFSLPPLRSFTYAPVLQLLSDY